MQSFSNTTEAEQVPSKPATTRPPDIAFASVLDLLATLRVNPDTGLTQAEVDVRREEHGWSIIYLSLPLAAVQIRQTACLYAAPDRGPRLLRTSLWLSSAS